ncbi:MAG: hypothetical protein KA076_07970, partial [Candidatus Marinimicrobia bacterium]|nr:hypothetical protein [Candidatus Neomarinimicrobiota bacterium]
VRIPNRILKVVAWKACRLIPYPGFPACVTASAVRQGIPVSPQIISDKINNVYSSNRVIMKIVIYYQLILIFETSIIKI